jgi:hypothetical protein
MVALLLVLAMATPTVPQTVSASPPNEVLNIRVYADRHVDKAIVRDATDAAERLLATAGVATRWRFCPSARDCPADADLRVVIFSSKPRVRERAVRLRHTAWRGFDRQRGDLGPVRCGVHRSHRLAL